MKFYEKLQTLRKEKGLSQEMLAEMLDVSRQAVSKWESGMTYPEVDKLIAISEIFNVTLDSLVKDDEPLDSKDGQRTADSAPYYPYRRNGYEYKSERTLFGLPLVHVNIGWGMKKAKGIIAIGNVASGLLSIGIASAGLLSIGVFNAGLIGIGAIAFGLIFAVGSIAVGTFAIGAIAIGVFALGALAIGMFSTGALAVATHMAIGNHAYGHIAIGQEVAQGARTFLTETPSHSLSSINAAEVKAAIQEEFPNMWDWITRLMTVRFR